MFPPFYEGLFEQVNRIKKYKEFFELFLEKTVGADFIFSHPDFSNVMECKKQAESLLPSDLDSIATRKQHEEYKKIEGQLGPLADEFTSYMKLLHEEPTSAIPWKKRAFRKSFNRKEPLKDDRYDIGGKKYGTNDLTPDILNAMKKQEETDIMSGVSPRRSTPKKTTPPGDNFVGSVSKVKVRWEDEVHTYNLLVFKQCLVFSKTRNKTMKVSRIIKLKQLWLSNYKDIGGFGHVEKEENACLGSWLGSELDPELLHRVIFSFSSKDARLHWYTTLQRLITAARRREVARAGLIKVYFKKSDSKLSVPGDNLWQGMSCQEIQIEPGQTVDSVIEDAVKKCQMKDNSYTLSFIVLQDNKIAIEEELIWMEMPHVIQTAVKRMLPDPKNMQTIFVLQENGSSIGSTGSSSSPTPSTTRLNTMVTFFRGRSNSLVNLRAPPPSQNLTPTIKPNNTVFGVHLSEFMGDAPEKVPSALLDLFVYLFNHCYNCEGIFRIPGSLAVQRSFENRLESGERIDWSAQEKQQDKFFLPNVASSLFKYYLRSLPGGLVPSSLFPELEGWRASSEEHKTVNTSISEMKLILAGIPTANHTILRYTMHTLKRIADFSTVNLMGVKVLSTCIGPSLITWPDDANALSILVDQYRRQTPCVVTEFMLEHVRELFGSEPRELERRKVVEDDMKSRVSAQKVDEVASSDEDTSSVWLMVRSSIQEHDQPRLDLALDSPAKTASAAKTESPTAAGVKSPVMFTFSGESDNLEPPLNADDTELNSSQNFGTLV